MFSKWMMLFAGVVVCGVSSTVTRAELDVRIPDITVTEGTSSVEVPILGSGDQAVTDMVLALQVGNGGTDANHPPVPRVESIVFTGTIWAGLSNGFNTFGDFLPPREVPVVNLNSVPGSPPVSGEGLLALATINLEGFSQSGNSWELSLETTFDDSTSVISGVEDVTGSRDGGNLSVVIPEPTSVAVFGLTGLALLARRRQSARG